jgi:hypothetical protein
MREEMHQYIKHHKISADGAEFDVIEDYTKILEEGRMKEYLNILSDGISMDLVLETQEWVKLWKKINLLRLYCQYRDENIQTFRGLNGFIYLEKLIIQIEVFQIETHLLRETHYSNRNSLIVRVIRKLIFYTNF